MPALADPENPTLMGATAWKTGAPMAVPLTELETEKESDGNTEVAWLFHTSLAHCSRTCLVEARALRRHRPLHPKPHIRYLRPR